MNNKCIVQRLSCDALSADRNDQRVVNWQPDYVLRSKISQSASHDPALNIWQMLSCRPGEMICRNGFSKSVRQYLGHVGQLGIPPQGRFPDFSYGNACMLQAMLFPHCFARCP